MAPGKEALYGSLDPTTLEWTDGIFTKVLREVRLTLRLFVIEYWRRERKMVETATNSTWHGTRYVIQVNIA